MEGLSIGLRSCCRPFDTSMRGAAVEHIEVNKIKLDSIVMQYINLITVERLLLKDDIGRGG